MAADATRDLREAGPDSGCGQCGQGGLMLGKVIIKQSQWGLLGTLDDSAALKQTQHPHVDDLQQVGQSVVSRFGHLSLAFSA
ncbi:hypothetical protein ACFL5O_04745 [Myxococcota bacterium]